MQNSHCLWGRLHTMRALCTHHACHWIKTTTNGPHSKPSKWCPFEVLNITANSGYTLGDISWKYDRSRASSTLRTGCVGSWYTTTICTVCTVPATSPQRGGKGGGNKDRFGCSSRQAPSGIWCAIQEAKGQKILIILLPPVVHLEERLTVSQSVSEPGKQSVRQSVRQAGRQNHTVWVFSVADSATPTPPCPAPPQGTRFPPTPGGTVTK